MTLALPDIGLGCANMLGATMSDLIDAAERGGFRRITVHPGAFAAALQRGWTEQTLRQRLDDAGLEVTMIDALASDSLPGVPVEGPSRALRAALPAGGLGRADEEMGFRSAEVLRCPMVNLTHYTGDPATPLEELAPAVGAVCRRAADRGLVVCLEFIPDTAIPDIATAQAVVEACGEPNVGILLDLFHHARSGGTVDDIGQLPSRSILAIQLSDRIPPPPGTPHVPLTGRVLPGEGELPVEELMAAALANNPDATVDIEVLNLEIRSMSPDEAAAYLAEGIRRWRASVESTP